MAAAITTGTATNTATTTVATTTINTTTVNTTITMTTSATATTMDVTATVMKRIGVPRRAGTVWRITATASANAAATLPAGPSWARWRAVFSVTPFPAVRSAEPVQPWVPYSAVS